MCMSWLLPIATRRQQQRITDEVYKLQVEPAMHSLPSRIRWSQELVVASANGGMGGIRWIQFQLPPCLARRPRPMQRGSHDHHHHHRTSPVPRNTDGGLITKNTSMQQYYRSHVQQLCSLCVSSSSSPSPCSLPSLSSSAAARSPRPSALRMNCSIA